MTVERHPCRCRECPCSSSTSVRGQPCPNCSAGAHRPPEHVQAHHRAGLEEWIRMQPITLGSSGLSDKQLTGARDAWLDWHGRRPCPTGWEAPR